MRGMFGSEADAKLLSPRASVAVGRSVFLSPQWHLYILAEPIELILSNRTPYYSL